LRTTNPEKQATITNAFFILNHKLMDTAIHSIQELTRQKEKVVPCVTIILPFEPKMFKRSHLERRLQKLVALTEKHLLKNYPGNTTELLLNKLNALRTELEFSTYKKSIVLNVSPDVQKIFYLDINVDEKIIIGDAFDTRDIVLNKHCNEEYLLLLMGTDKAKLFHVRGVKHSLLINNKREHIRNEKMASNIPEGSNDLLTRKFIRHVDDGLSIILKAYPVPLVLACTEEAANNFRHFSKLNEQIIKFIPGNYEEGNASQIKQLMEVCERDWRKVKEGHLLLQVGRAFSHNKCSIGIKEVFKMASQKRGIKLIVEKTYSFPAFTNENKEVSGLDDPIPENSIYIDDAVNEVIEKVLSNSGDVEFVSDGVLDGYFHIALIHYY
jgi:hypothetical protein